MGLGIGLFALTLHFTILIHVKPTRTSIVDHSSGLNSSATSPSSLSSNFQVAQTCMYKSKAYGNMEKIKTSNPCKNCICVGGDVLCGLESCPPSPSNPNEKCVEKKEQGQCCPMYHCHEVDASTTRETVPSAYGCTAKGKSYNVGDVITLNRNVSTICKCQENGLIQCSPNIQ